MSRRGLEFKKSEKVAMFIRAGGPGKLACEGCGLPLMGKPFEYDHTVEIWELPSELREKFIKQGFPAEYGKLLGYCCHKPKTAKKSGERAHGERIVAKAAKATPKKRPQSKFKKKIDGTVVWRETGEPVR